MDPIGLTKGAVPLMSTGESDKTDFLPVMQVADIRLVNNTQNQSTERYRVVLSDGEFTLQGMLATQLNEMVKSEKLMKGSIVQLREFVCTNIQGHMIVIIINLHVIRESCEIIGVTKPYTGWADGNAASLAKTLSNLVFI